MGFPSGCGLLAALGPPSGLGGPKLGIGFAGYPDNRCEPRASDCRVRRFCPSRALPRVSPRSGFWTMSAGTSSYEWGYTNDIH